MPVDFDNKTAAVVSTEYLEWLGQSSGTLPKRRGKTDYVRVIKEHLYGQNVSHRVVALLNPPSDFTAETASSHPILTAVAEVTGKPPGHYAIWRNALPKDQLSIHAVITTESREQAVAAVSWLAREVEAGQDFVDGQTGLVQYGDGTKEGGQTLREERPKFSEAFRTATTEDLAKLPSEDLAKIKDTIRQAEVLQGCRLIGLPDGQKLTVGKLNRFFRERAGELFNDEEQLRISRVIQSFRQSTGYKLYFVEDNQKIECTFDIMNHPRGDGKLIRVRTAGDHKSLWNRPRFPQLKISKS